MNEHIYLGDALIAKHDDLIKLWQDCPLNFEQISAEPSSKQNTEQDTKAALLGQVDGFVDGRRLACPMPLLKLKLALRQLDQLGQAVRIYLVATDINSVTDIDAFCQKNVLEHHTWQTNYQNLTIFHFWVIKSAGVCPHKALK